MASTARKRRIETSAGRKMATVLDGLYSADEEEDLDTDMHSPTDGSEDSVDVKVKPIGTFTSSCKSKRKCAEPRKFGEVKQIKVDFCQTESENGPFRPWNHEHPSSPPCGYIPAGYPVIREQRESPGPSHSDQEQPLSLVLRDVTLERLPPAAAACSDARPGPGPQEVVRLPQDPARAFCVESLICPRPGTSSSTSSVTDKRKSLSGQSQQRNYKNMTRERRVEANARERTRVHTISAAFDTLRRAVPAYSHNQKLSKLSVLRIACSYILTLSRVAGRDYSEDGSQPPLADCVDNVTRTIQMEGKLRKKKDD